MNSLIQHRHKRAILMLLLGFTVSFYAQQRPNIVWINADDLGIELGCYGNTDVKTPNIDRLAKQGVLYQNAYATASICSASRSSMITGMYPSSVNSLNHRTIHMTELPQGIEAITTYFKNEGYFCTNGKAVDMSKMGKLDFNFLAKDIFEGTDWTQRNEDQPFFAQVQIREPHRAFIRDLDNPIDPDRVTLPECYPEHPLLKADWALYLESIQECDKQVGQILDRLEDEGLAENTVVFFFGDNGRPHIRDKQFLYEGGLKVPLIVRYPNKIKSNKVEEELVSLIDVTATSLELAGIKIPDHIQGNVFLGENASKRRYIYGFRQRAGDAVEDMRSIREGRYKLIWNRKPEVPWMQLSGYKKAQYPGFSLYHVLYKSGQLKAPYNQFMAKTKPEIELYDLKNDPMEFNNLASDKKYTNKKNQLLDTLSANLLIFDRNLIEEDDATIKKAQRASAKFFKEKIVDLNPDFDENTSYKDILKAWETKLLNN